MATPLVSVCVASFNNSTYIQDTLNSVRDLKYPILELFVIDDASTDDSVSVIEQWLTQNASVNGQLIAHTANQGICRVWNRFLEEAGGKYVCLIGSDDIYLPHKLATQVALLETAPPEVGVVFSDVTKIDLRGEVLVPSIYATGQISPSSGDVWLPMLRTNFIPAMTTLIRRSCFNVVGLYDETLAYEDWDMWLRLAREFEFLYQPDITAQYRIHGGSAMHRRKIQIIETNMHLLQKQLGVSTEGDAVIYQHIAAFAEELYLLGSSNSAYWLARRWKYRPDARGLALLAAAQLGVPAPWVSRAYGWVKVLKR